MAFTKAVVVWTVSIAPTADPCNSLHAGGLEFSGKHAAKSQQIK